MFSAVSLEGIINSKKNKKIQKLGNLVLFVEEIMCAKTEVIWRWLEKCTFLIFSQVTKYIIGQNIDSTTQQQQMHRIQ